MIWLCLLALLSADSPTMNHRSQSLVVEAWAPPLLMQMRGPSSTTGQEKKANKSSPFARNKSNNNKASANVKRKRRNSANGATPKRSNPNKNKTNKPSASNPNNPVKSKPKSIGEAVQQAQTVPELLDVASQFWLPTDATLPAHLRTQALHHERRQRWGAQWLSKMGTACLCENENNSKPWQDDRLARAVLAAALPFDNELPVTDKDLRTLREALLGLHTLVGPMEPSELLTVHEDILQGIRLMLERVEAHADRFLLPEALEVRWAARGLAAKLGASAVVPTLEQDDNLPTSLASSFPRLEERAQGLPFDILPAGVDFASLRDINDGLEEKDILTSLQESIPFHFDTIVTRTGARVTERRGTAWVAQEGIGALAYSGKLMPPSPLPPLVSHLMRQVEMAVDAPGLEFFDCALCNFYPDGESACKFHTDPEHGTLWERLNCVVSVGASRRFAFRPIPDETTWGEWDGTTPTTVKEDSATVPAVIRLFPGDIVSMWGQCNDLFHHAVYPESETTTTQSGQKGDPRRVSLVLKRAIVQGRGRRGHGLAGEGRRSRRQKTQLH